MAEDNTKNLRKALLMLGERYQQKAYNMTSHQKGFGRKNNWKKSSRVNTESKKTVMLKEI